MYVIVNSVRKKLSGFYPNACIGKLAYREHDWYGYRAKEDAEEHLAHIQEYGLGKNLKIVEE